MSNEQRGRIRATGLGAWLAESPHTRSIMLQAVTAPENEGDKHRDWKAVPGVLRVTARVNVFDASGRPTVAVISIRFSDDLLHEEDDGGEYLTAELQLALAKFMQDRGASEGKVRFANGTPIVERPYTTREGT